MSSFPLAPFGRFAAILLLALTTHFVASFILFGPAGQHPAAERVAAHATIPGDESGHLPGAADVGPPSFCDEEPCHLPSAPLADFSPRHDLLPSSETWRHGFELPPDIHIPPETASVPS